MSSSSSSAIVSAGAQQQQAEEGPAFKVPCAFKGLEAVVSGGILGYVFGLGSKMMFYSGGGGLKGRWAAARLEAGGSARTFAIFGGVLSAAQCYVYRVRNKEGPINGAIAG